MGVQRRALNRRGFSDKRVEARGLSLRTQVQRLFALCVVNSGRLWVAGVTAPHAQEEEWPPLTRVFAEAVLAPAGPPHAPLSCRPCFSPSHGFFLGDSGDLQVGLHLEQRRPRHSPPAMSTSPPRPTRGTGSTPSAPLAPATPRATPARRAKTSSGSNADELARAEVLELTLCVVLLSPVKWGVG